MLDRAPDAERQRETPGAARARWQREYRRRQREGAKLIEVSSAAIEMLITTHWLREHEAGDARAISRALDAMAREMLTARPPKIFR